jgi:LmbE family N-acetylglucosaminyl deacetylase/SAM-dependent methyltransferase
MNAPTASHFDHRDPGTTAAMWTGLLDSLARATLPPPDVPILVVAAHPDDETLGAGALIAAASLNGNPLTVLVASFGEASHPRSPTHSPPALAAIRRRELTAAVRALAPQARLHTLALPDGHHADHEPEIRRAINDALPDGPPPGPNWLVAPWEGDRHPDHTACSRAARRATGDRRDIVLWEYPIWAWHWATPGTGDLPEAALQRLDVPDAAAARRATALACYRSQTLALSGEEGDEPILPAGFAAHFARPFDVLLDPRGIAADSGYFDALYAESDDPWGLADRWYERRKRNILLASLPRARFGRAFEPGCAGGLLTEGLAPRCDELLAVDASARAVQLCARRMRARPTVTVEQMAIPTQWPSGRFDLLVLSEVGYYVDDLGLLADRVASSVRPGGVLVACHWRHPVLEHRHRGDEVHAVIAAVPGLHRTVAHVERDFRLEVFATSDVSVAEQEGLVRP